MDASLMAEIERRYLAGETIRSIESSLGRSISYALYTKLGLSRQKRILPRDARGWRIPRDGTRSRKIYDLLITGKGTNEIHREIGGSYKTVAVLLWRIKHPEAANRINRAA